MKQRRALVTGGAGFLGSHLCDALLADGYTVVVDGNSSNPAIFGGYIGVTDGGGCVAGDTSGGPYNDDGSANTDPNAVHRIRNVNTVATRGP